ncbi:MAG TPA: UbiA family prenyltransferase [Beijerinckiaceae bacterium]
MQRRLEQDAAHAPLAIGLNGTLVATDTLHEGYVAAFRGAPMRSALLLRSIREGKAAFKRRIAAASAFDPAMLPYNQPLVAYLKEQKLKGRRIGLFTAADRSIAEAVASHLGLFDVVRGSDGVENLSGTRKLEAIRDAFGTRFAYAGEAPADRPIIEAAESVVLIEPGAGAGGRLAHGSRIEAVFPAATRDARTWAKALRLEHWAKNILVFVAPVLAHQVASLATMAQALLLFLLMGMLASATYVINDLFDLAADRKHPAKRHRSFAAGQIPVRHGAVVAGGLIFAALALSLALPAGCTLALSAYLIGTLAYSFVLKRLPVVDVIVLAGLFTLRIVAGGFLVPDRVSPWLLTFSMLFFLGLAVVKRYAELERGTRAGGEEFGSRGYTGKDLPLLLSTGVSSGLGAIIIFTIYLINDQYPREIYRNPQVLWAMMPILLLWTLRVWHLAVHGRMNEDPVVFAIKDRVSLGLGALVAVVLIGASW